MNLIRTLTPSEGGRTEVEPFRQSSARSNLPSSSVVKGKDFMRDKKGRFVKGNKAHLGYINSLETRKKMSKIQKGRKNYNYKNKFSLETRKKMSEGLKKAYKEGRRVGFKKGNIPLNKKTKKERLETKRFYNQRYKARKKDVLGSHTFEEWLVLKSYCGNMCLCCKRTEPEIKLTEDHIIPISKGGSDYIENIQPLCQSCNSKKYIKVISYLPVMVEGQEACGLKN